VSPGSAPMRVCRYNVLLGVLLSRTPVPTSTASPRSRHRGTLYLPVIDLAPRGEGGMVASAEEAESNTTRAARAAQGCTEDVRMGAGDKTHE